METFRLVMAGCFGLVVGSFLNVVIHRLPLGESVVTPRSRCPHCGHQITALENVPSIASPALVVAATLALRTAAAGVDCLLVDLGGDVDTDSRRNGRGGDGFQPRHRARDRDGARRSGPPGRGSGPRPAFRPARRRDDHHGGGDHDERDDDGDDGLATSWVGCRLLGTQPEVAPVVQAESPGVPLPSPSSQMPSPSRRRWRP